MHSIKTYDKKVATKTIYYSGNTNLETPTGYHNFGSFTLLSSIQSSRLFLVLLEENLFSPSFIKLIADGSSFNKLYVDSISLAGPTADNMNRGSPVNPSSSYKAGMLLAKTFRMSAHLRDLDAAVHRGKRPSLPLVLVHAFMS